jgi:hypothetical protein
MGPKSSSRTGTRTITPSKTDQEEEAAVGNQYASKTELLEWINGLLQLQLSRCVYHRAQRGDTALHWF